MGVVDGLVDNDDATAALIDENLLERTLPIMPDSISVVILFVVVKRPEPALVLRLLPVLLSFHLF